VGGGALLPLLQQIEQGVVIRGEVRISKGTGVVGRRFDVVALPARLPEQFDCFSLVTDHVQLTGADTATGIGVPLPMIMP
jgi:hypothetical protein